MKPNGQPPCIQVALATGKLVLPEQGCLGQGGCEAKPDYEGAEASAYDPVRKLWATEGELALSRESLLAIGGMRAGTRLRQGVEASGHEPVRKHWATEGELVSSRKSLVAIGGMRAGT